MSQWVDERIFIAIIIHMEQTARGRGRPRKTAKEKRTFEFRIMLTDEERRELERAANGMTSTWAREILLKQAKKQLAR